MPDSVTPPSIHPSPGNKPPVSKKREGDTPSESKPKRTRTGCLTCRERHLKCDETKPICNNCSKSQRECSWGKRLNFLGTTCEKNAYLIPKGVDYQVAFQDESRVIAAEYVGGREMYPVQDMESLHMRSDGVNMGPPSNMPMSSATRQQLLPMMHDMGAASYHPASTAYDFSHQSNTRQHRRATFNYANQTTSLYTIEHPPSPAQLASRDYLRN